MTKKNISLSCGLYVGVVFMCNVFAPVYSQRSLISSTTNSTTLTGETIKFDCSELTILTKTTTFEWSLNGKPLPIEKNKMRMSLEKNDRILMITNVTSYDNGVYKCDISDKYRSDYSIFNFTVRESPKLEIHKRAVVNDILNVGERTRLNCLNELLQGTLATQIEEVTWLKNGIPYFIESGDRVKFDNNELTIMIKSIVFEDQGIYECTASNTFRIDNAVYNITVVDSQETKVYNNYDANFTRYYGESVSWCCILNTEFSVDDFSYTWFKNNTRIHPNYSFKFHNFMLELNGITRKDEGTYTCSASNVTNNITGRLKFSLTAFDRPNIINHLWYTSKITAITGANLMLKCESFYSSRTLNNKYQWNMEGIKSYNYHRIDSNDLTNNTFYLNNIVFDNNGTYYCDSSNLYFIFRSNYMLHVIDSPEPEKNGRSYSILVFIVLFSISIVLAACYVISLKREQALKKILEDSRLQFENGDIDKWNPDLGIEEQAELLPYDKQWEFPIDKLKIGKQLGSGAFGVVFKADATGIIDQNTTSTVAVKMIKPNSESFYTKSLISELKIMIYLGKHLNVVNLLGACTEDINNNLMVIVEYCRFGNIREYLLKHRDCFINQITPDGFFDFNIKTTSKNLYYENCPKIINTTGQRENKSTSVDPEGYLLPDEMEPIWRNNYSGDYNSGDIQPLNTHDLLCWSFQVARGMEYLASKKILHGDLAIRNILLADDNVIKICDFGFAKTMLNSEVYKKSSGVPLPVKWMAIESIRDRVFSIQSDVWSFGIVLWEIFSLAVNPYPNVESCYDLFNRLVDGYRMEQPKYANFQLHKIMLDCWNINPQARPSFTDLAGYLGDFLKDGSTSYYVNLNEVYVKKFTKNTSNTDYINMFISPPYEKRSTMFENNSNLQLEKNSENKEKLHINY